MKSNIGSEAESSILCYVPVLHRGYLKLFDDAPKAEIGIIDGDVIANFDYLQKDVRALEPEQALKLLENYYEDRTVRLIGHTALQQLSNCRDRRIIVPEHDDVANTLVEEYFGRHEVRRVPVFLRWNRVNTSVNQETEPDTVIEAKDIPEGILTALLEERDKSHDWWRQIGGVITKAGEVLLRAHNRPQTQYTHNIDGDPRVALNRGTGIDVSLFYHAESTLIAQAARQGAALEGAEMYVTTFPCPPCAKNIVTAGIKRLYYVDGYAMSIGQDDLRNAGVEIVRIDNFPPQVKTTSEWREYPEK